MTQLWRRRQEIPDPQVRDAADQFNRARELLLAQPPGSGVLLPLINISAVAIELYLKCLSAEKVYIEKPEGGWSTVTAKPVLPVHVLTRLLDKVGHDLQQELDGSFRAQCSTLGNPSFRDALEQCDGAFQASRYPFETESNVAKYPLGLLMACSHFLEQFIAHMETRETIQY